MTLPDQSIDWARVKTTLQARVEEDILVYFDHLTIALIVLLFGFGPSIWNFVKE